MIASLCLFILGINRFKVIAPESHMLKSFKYSIAINSAVSVTHFVRVGHLSGPLQHDVCVCVCV